MPNPIWVSIITSTLYTVTKKCTHCGKSAKYAKKQAGQLYTCKKCGHRFKERSDQKKK